MTTGKLSRKILLVDDDPDDRKSFMEAVNEIDNTVICVTAKDGHEALIMLQDPTAWRGSLCNKARKYRGDLLRNFTNT